MDFDIEDIEGAFDSEGLFENEDLPTIVPLTGLHENENDKENEAKGAGESAAEKTKSKGRKATGQPLNEKLLCSKKGITALAGIFEDVKFNAHSEKENLNILLSKYEYWAHQMFPRHSFEDVLDKVEVLGAKKVVRRHAQAIKLGDVDQLSGFENIEVSSKNDPLDERIEQIDQVKRHDISSG